TGVSILQSQQLHGSGIKIGIVDSGIDYEHPALGGCFGKGCCVAHGHDLVGDAYDGKNKPVPSERPPRDCMGHGTQVAGIIAADSPSIQGVAPAAILGAYRVIGCTGVTSGHLLRKAIVL
ncbi:peptidase S8/S53 domain-containing protein, partial [Syncephalis pseudoplumigaleata]